MAGPRAYNPPMRAFARIAIGLAVVLAVALVGAIVFVSTLDPNTLIAPVQAQVKAATGRDLAVKGGARIALSLHPRIVLTDVTLSNAPWGKAPQLAKIERLELAAALVPLLARRFDLEEIVLTKPEVALETDGRGGKNWLPQATGGGAASSGAPGHPGIAAAIAIGDVRITDGVVTYRDGAGAAVSRVTIDSLSLDSRALSSSVAIDFRGAVGDLPLAVEGKVGALSSLLARSWPYPVDLKGQVAGQAFAIAAKVTASGQVYSLDDLALSLGANALTGSFSADASGPRTRVTFAVEAPALALRALPVPAVPAAAPASAATPAKAPRNHVFPDTPMSFAPLRWADAQGKLSVGKLSLASGQQYDNVRAALTIAGGRLDVHDFSVGAMGGTVSGNLMIDASASDDAPVTLRVDGKGLALGALLAVAGQKRDVRGGKTDVSASLAMRGNSAHAWASTATGNVRAVSGPATLVNTKIDAGVAWDEINAAINPFRTRDPSTDLTCAVVRLPLSNGVAKVDRTIAAETSKIGVSASGTLDFRNETLDFTFEPRIRKGIAIDFAGFSNLVRVTGTFASPHLAVDVAGSAKVIASVGAAIGTSGLSAVGQALFSWAEGKGPGPCAVALGEAPPPAAAQSEPAADPAAQGINAIGKALGKLFGK